MVRREGLVALESAEDEGIGHRVLEVLEGEDVAGLGKGSVEVVHDILVLELEGIHVVVVHRSTRPEVAEGEVGCIGLAEGLEVGSSLDLEEGHHRAVAAGKGGSLVEADAHMGDIHVLETGGQCGSIRTVIEKHTIWRWVRHDRCTDGWYWRE